VQLQKQLNHHSRFG